MDSINTKAWSYFVDSTPGSLPVSLADMKTWLKVTGTSEDAVITALIESATLTGERITKRDFINKQYKTFRDIFSDLPAYYPNYGALVPGFNRFSSSAEIELRKSKLQTVNSVEYLKDSVFTPVASTVFYATEEFDFSRLVLFPDQAWPTDIDNRRQAVKIEFVAGYGDAGNVPSDLKTAIKKHVANAFTNRGDCDDESFLPKGALATYMNNRIIDIV